MEGTFSGWSSPDAGWDQNITIGPDSLNYEGELYQDSLFSDIPIVGPIIDWIEAQLTHLYDWLVYMYNWVIDQLRSVFQAIFNTLLAPLINAVIWVKDKLLDAWHWVTSEIPKALEYIKVKLLDAWSWVTSAIPKALEYIKVKLLDTWSWVTSAIPNALSWIQSHITSLLSKVAEIPSAISSAVANIINSIGHTLSSMFTPICDGFNAIFKNVGPDIQVALAHNTPAVKDLVLSWQPKGTPFWDWFRYTVKFVLFTPFMNWDIIHQENLSGEERLKAFMNSDISDPILDGIKFLFEKLAEILKAAFDAIWGAIKEFFTVILPGWFKSLWDALHTAVSWIWDKVSAVATWFWDEILKLVHIHSPITPEGGLGTVQGVLKVSLALVGGLGIMTVLGNLVHPLHSLGLEHISAMIYDLTNYRLLTGAAMGVIAAASIRTPLTYYFNTLLRPNIPPEREVSDMYNRELISLETFKQYLGYRGYPDLWHDNLAHLTETPIRYFTLAAIAKAGFFDAAFFTRELTRGGYPPDTREALMRMFQSTYSEVIKGLMSGTAIKRYKEGMTTQEQFHAELLLLGYTEQQWPQYLAAAKLDYAYDYITDLIAAYRDAVRKGNISLDEYRSSLIGLGIVPERVEAYVLRERARLKPTEPLKPIAPPKPTYETDAGKIQVDTLRRQRRKELITEEQETAGLIQLGMPLDYARAIAANDDARLAEKGGGE